MSKLVGETSKWCQESEAEHGGASEWSEWAVRANKQSERLNGAYVKCGSLREENKSDDKVKSAWQSEKKTSGKT